MGTAVLLFYLLTSSLAQGPYGVCPNLSSQAEVSDFKKLKDICCQSFYESEAAMNYDLAFPFEEERVVAEINGSSLSGTKLQIEATKKMLGKEPPLQWASRTKDCKSVLCAWTQIFDSEEAAKRALSFYKTTGYVFSVGSFIWPAKEIRAADRAVRVLPPKFLHLKTLEVFVRAPDGEIFRDDPTNIAFSDMPQKKKSGSVTTGLIKIFDRILRAGPGESYSLRVIHEMAHHYDFSNYSTHGQMISDSAVFKKLSGWKSGKHMQDKKFVTEYSAQAQEEDFSEAVAYYVMKPDLLKKIDPEKYSFIKSKIFDDKTFAPLDHSQCASVD